jgi:hypothetical protein
MEFRMYARLPVLVTVATFGTLFGAQAQPADRCDTILQSAANESSISIQSNEFLNSLFDRTCTSTGQARSDSGSIGYGGFSLGFGSSGSSVSNFCTEYKLTRYSNVKSDDYKQRVSGKALDTYLECRKAAARGIAVEHRFVSKERMVFTVGAPPGRPIQIRGFDAPSNVRCQTIVMEQGNPQGTPVTLDVTKVISTNDTFTFFCVRDSEKETGGQGQKLYSEVGISFGMSEGSYSVLWPREEAYPETLASNIAQSLANLSANVSTQEQELRRLKGGRLIAQEIEPNEALGRPVSQNGGWGIREAPRPTRIPGSEKYAFCTISSVRVTPKIDSPSDCELRRDTSLGWTIRVSDTARCQVTCFKMEAEK